MNFMNVPYVINLLEQFPLLDIFLVTNYDTLNSYTYILCIWESISID